jgi:sugar phosphate isomerase/epimerase
MSNENRPGDALHQKHMNALNHVVDMAHVVGSPLVRMMTQKKEQILRCHNGAEQWNVAKGAWDTMPPMIAPAMDVAREAGVTLVVERGNGTMVNSNYNARKLIDELDAKDTLKVLWDPANNCWCHDLAYPDGYAMVRDGYLGHIQIKDVLVDSPRATLPVKKMGEGQLASLLAPLAKALRRDSYDGVIFFESVYHSGNGNF